MWVGESVQLRERQKERGVVVKDQDEDRQTKREGGRALEQLSIWWSKGSRCKHTHTHTHLVVCVVVEGQGADDSKEAG